MFIQNFEKESKTTLCCRVDCQTQTKFLSHFKIVMMDQKNKYLKYIFDNREAKSAAGYS